MARSVNVVFLLGNVGSDPEIRETGKGLKVANFSLATERSWGKKETDWHRVTGWGKVAEIVEKFVKKGDRLHIQGTVQYQSWEDKDGNTRYSTDIVIDRILMLGGKDSEGGGAKKEAKKPAEKKPLSEPEDESLPF